MNSLVLSAVVLLLVLLVFAAVRHYLFNPDLLIPRGPGPRSQRKGDESGPDEAPRPKITRLTEGPDS